MSGEDKKTQPERTPVSLRYDAPSQVAAEAGGAAVRLQGEASRDPVRLEARVTDALRLRESLSALYAIVESDFRYVPRDRTAYAAYQQLRRESANESAWSAQRAYFDWLQRNDPLAWVILDPVVSVYPDAVAFEVFSRDEGSYTRLSVDRSMLECETEPTCGTTNVDFSRDLFEGLQRMRSYRETRLSIGRDAPGDVALETEGAPPVLEKKLQLPNSWLRGFLQVQSAMTLPHEVCSLAPIDLYNVLRHLRMHADQKRKGRALRVELVPGEPARLVLEPWETVIPSTGAPYRGRRAQVVKLWGRRRLSLLRRILPFAESIDLHLLGSGMPSFWVIRAGAVTLTLGLTGFTSANWSSAIQFDLLLPRGRDDAQRAAVGAWLAANRSGSLTEIADAAGCDAAAARAALQSACQDGQVVYDLAAERYRIRPLTGAALELEPLRYRSGPERIAHDLLAVDGAVKIERLNRIADEGVEVVAAVDVAADRRSYRPQLLIDGEGRVRKAECTCNQYRQHKLKEGPCPHILAARILQAREAARAIDPNAITDETRTYVRRRGAGEQVYQVSLEQQRLQIRWGERGSRWRRQSLVFNSVAAARDAYLARLSDLEARGFLDAG